MKMLLAAVAATALFAAPAMADCVSDLAKADAIIQSGQLDPETAAAADFLAGRAKSAKTDGEFENCASLTRELFAMLDGRAVYPDDGRAYN